MEYQQFNHRWMILVWRLHKFRYLLITIRSTVYPTPGTSRLIAKDILASCYQADVIGSYRRIGSSWKIRLADIEVVLDDSQVIRMLGRKVRRLAPTD